MSHDDDECKRNTDEKFYCPDIECLCICHWEDEDEG